MELASLLEFASHTVLFLTVFTTRDEDIGQEIVEEGEEERCAIL